MTIQILRVAQYIKHAQLYNEQDGFAQDARKKIMWFSKGLVKPLQKNTQQPAILESD